MTCSLRFAAAGRRDRRAKGVSTSSVKSSIPFPVRAAATRIGSGTLACTVEAGVHPPAQPESDGRHEPRFTLGLTRPRERLG